MEASLISGCLSPDFNSEILSTPSLQGSLRSLPNTVAEPFKAILCLLRNRAPWLGMSQSPEEDGLSSFLV